MTPLPAPPVPYAPLDSGGLARRLETILVDAERDAAETRRYAEAEAQHHALGVAHRTEHALGERVGELTDISRELAAQAAVVGQRLELLVGALLEAADRLSALGAPAGWPEISRGSTRVRLRVSERRRFTEPREAEVVPIHAATGRPVVESAPAQLHAGAWERAASA